MQLEAIHQESLGNIVGGTPEVLDYNLRDAHERGYFTDAVTVGDVCGGYVSYLADMIAGHGVSLRLKGPIHPASVSEVATDCLSDAPRYAARAVEISACLEPNERENLRLHGIVPQHLLDRTRAEGFDETRLVACVRDHLFPGI